MLKNDKSEPGLSPKTQNLTEFQKKKVSKCQSFYSKFLKTFTEIKKIA